MSDGEPVGMTCQSFASVSLSPPLVLFCPSRASRAWPFMHRAGHFCVNILSDGQQDLSDAMATKGSEKFVGVGWSSSKTGAPLLDGVAGYVDCTVEAVHEAGDHLVVIGRVQDLGHGEAPPARDPCCSTAAATPIRGSTDLGPDWSQTLPQTAHTEWVWSPPDGLMT